MSLPLLVHRLAIACMLVCTGASAPTPTAEFDIPYALHVQPDGAVLEVSGSFSWALPQTLQAHLAAAPQVRVVRLDSPGGHVQPAMQVAALIRDRGLDTNVGRFCASACTVAFLGGRRRSLALHAKLGFHRAYGPGLTAEQANGYLRQAYEQYAVPASFIDHVLSTPASELWFPTEDELRAARVITVPPPAVATRATLAARRGP